MPDWRLDDSLRTVTVKFPGDRPIALTLGVADVDDILRNLGDFRAYMQPEVPQSFPPGPQPTLIDPKWTTESELLQGLSLLHLRHPGYGWLHFAFPPADALRMAQALRGQAENPPSAGGSA